MEFTALFLATVIVMLAAGRDRWRWDCLQPC
jgi:hypothetical protein